MKEDTSQRVFASIGATTSLVDSTLKVPLPEQILGGRYRLIKRVGSGGMGFVFLAEQLGLGITVAIKFLDPQDARDDASRVARFLREGKVGLEVKHPGAAQLLDVGHNDEGHLFLVFFELLTGAPAFDGKNLTTILGHQVYQPMPMLSGRDATWYAPELESFLQRTCAKRQGERFQSMSEVIVALKGLPAPERSMQRARAPEVITQPAPKSSIRKTPPSPVF
jgi:hypothetical protein